MWNDANKILPDKDGDYLVVIEGAKIPTVLSFDAKYGVFYDEGKYRRIPEAVAKNVNDGVWGLHANTGPSPLRYGCK